VYKLKTNYIQPIYETNEVKESNILKVRYQLNFSPWDGPACFFLGALEPEVFNYLKDKDVVDAEIVEIYGEFPYRIDSYELNQKLPMKEVIPEIVYKPNWNEDNFFTRLEKSIKEDGLKHPIPVCIFDEDFVWCGKEYKKDVPYMGNIGNSRYAVFKHMRKRKLPVNIWYFSKTNKRVLLDLARVE